ncbi:MAG: hypothetical protein V1859_01805 [archaeon]
MIIPPLDNPDDVDYVSDWVELYVTLNKNSISKATLKKIIEETSGMETEDTFVDFVFQRLQNRSSLYGKNSPIEAEGNLVVSNINWKKNPEYVMNLLLSLWGNNDEIIKTGKLFEKFSAEAIKKYTSGEVIIYGHPSKQTIKEICDEIKEDFCKEPPPQSKDSGVDVIAWKSFGDNKPSQLIVLFQCASGFNWDQKLLEIPLKRWSTYITWVCDPVKGFTFPKIIPYEKFKQKAYDCGILFDRARLYRYTFDSDIPDLRSEILEWCNVRLEGIKNEVC